MRPAPLLLPLLFATALPGLAGAQALAPDVPRPAYLRVGVGRTEGAGTIYHSARAFVEYAPLLGRHWGWAGRLAGVAGAPTQGLESQVPHQNYRAGYAEAEGRWYPWGNHRRVTVALGAGGFAGYYRHNGYDYFQGVNGRLVDYGLAAQQGFHAGLLGSVNAEVGLGAAQRWRAGLQILKQTGLGGVTAFTSHSLTLGYRI